MGNGLSGIIVPLDLLQKIVYFLEVKQLEDSLTLLGLLDAGEVEAAQGFEESLDEGKQLLTALSQIGFARPVSYSRSADHL